MMKKADLLLLAIVLALAAISLLIVREVGAAPAESVSVSVDGVVTAQYGLNEDRTFTVEAVNGGYVTVVVENGRVDVTSASCPDKICVKHRPVSRTGESIVCLPGRVVITICGADNELDGVSK